MNKILRWSRPLLLAVFASAAGAQERPPLPAAPSAQAPAPPSAIRVRCDGDSEGAEVFVNQVSKGECPVDVSLPEGTAALRVVKAVDADHERVFEKTFKIAAGTFRSVNVDLPPPVLTDKGRLAQAERAAAAQEKARLKEEQLHQEAQARREAAQRAQEQALAVANARVEAFHAAGLRGDGQGKSFRDCDVCPEMVWLEPGRPYVPPASAAQHWLSRVTIDYPLAVGKFSVTFDDYDRCVAEGGCQAKPVDGFTAGLFTSHWGRGRQPLVEANLLEAQAYLRWLSRRSGVEYRLLSLAEFLYAARAGATTQFPWGDEVGSRHAQCANCSSGLADDRTVTVGSFAANRWGLHDMVGNVWQLLADCAPTEEGLQSEPLHGEPISQGCIEDSAQLVNALGPRHMKAGGAWDSPLAGGIPLSVDYFPAGRGTTMNVGFRVARVFKEPRP